MPASSKIKGAWGIIKENVDDVVREMSQEKYGHAVGNLTVADIKHHLTYTCGVDALASNALAGGAYKRHEQWRFSDEGKKVHRLAFVAESDVAESDVAESDVAESDVAESDVAESDVAESDVAES